MPEKENDRTIFTLLEVTKSIQKTLSERYKSSFWVKAEMNKLNLYPSSGHCYPDLVEKKDGKVIAEIMANIWRDDYQRINNNFLKVLKEPMKSGINILFCAKINYTPENGLRLRIIDIDPSYSLGNLEKEKQETIDKLKLEGIYNTNRSLQLPLLPKRIAIISVQTSKGYSDFIQIIETNPWGYNLFHMLFPALLQGDRAAETIMNQLIRIRKVKDHFDAVAIIRGGGGDVGLTCYNNYELSKAIALFPIPVITGIGHSTNETVSEMIAFKNAITPTELADFLLQRFHNFSVPVQKAQETISDKTRRLLKEENLRLFNSVRYFKSITGNLLIKSHNEIHNKYRSLLQLSAYFIQRNREYQVSLISGLKRNTQLQLLNGHQQVRQTGLIFRKDVITYLNRSKAVVDQSVFQIRRGARLAFAGFTQNIDLAKIKLFDRGLNFIKNEKRGIEVIEKNIALMSPENVLRRGYSITMINGKVLQKVEDVGADDELITIISDGQISSVVNKIKKTE
jgi:exodeoxyribonuclease VII large subunit